MKAFRFNLVADAKPLKQFNQCCDPTVFEDTLLGSSEESVG
jgi:hypothetical protein